MKDDKKGKKTGEGKLEETREAISGFADVLRQTSAQSQSLHIRNQALINAIEFAKTGNNDNAGSVVEIAKVFEQYLIGLEA